MDLFFSDAFKVFLNSYCCVCVPLNYWTCEKNGAIEMQHNNNNYYDASRRRGTCVGALATGSRLNASACHIPSRGR